jgi:transcriptional regulator with XRE-family HTH domain
MPGAVAATLDRIQQNAGIRSRDVAQLLGTTQQTVSRWRHSKADPQPSTLTRLLALEWVATQLAAFYAPDESRLWLYRPHSLLSGERPADRIQRGEIDSVLALIDQLKSGAYT